jgi:Fe2+ or Zn2+ uptake regulation protein
LKPGQLDTNRRQLYNEIVRMRIIRKYPGQLQGHAQTKQRLLLLDLLGAARGHVDAKQLFSLAAARDPSISPATVYRNLSLFKKLGLVDEQRLGQARCYYDARHGPRHQHLVCRGCGETFDFDCPLGEIVERVRRQYGFSVTRAEVSLEGYCPRCAEQQNKEKSFVKDDRED